MDNNATQTVFAGFLITPGGERIDVEFSAPTEASRAELDQAFLNQLSQVVHFDYLEMGDLPQSSTASGG